MAATRGRGEQDRPDAIAFDAMLELVRRAASCGTDPTGSDSRVSPASSVPNALVNVRVDHAALRRGHTRPGEVCEIVGGGPIPARMRSALVERQLECVIAGCHADRHLEIDHNQPIEAGGSTALWNLNRLCPHHHRHKHEHDLRLVGTGSDQRFVPAAEWSAPGDHPP